MSALETRRKSNLWTRERTVSGTLCGSVVASTNSTCAGGSSSVFRKAFHASVVSMCASSMMYTLRRSEAGRYFTFSRRSRISSMPRLLAASISRTSTELPSRISRQAVHSLHGSPSRGARQLTARARMRAVDVFPVPRIPVKRYACASEAARTSLRSVVAMTSWPTRSAKRADRYRR